MVGFSSEQQRTLALLRDPRSYAPFSLTHDLRRMVGCIDPRDEQREGELKVLIQTPGGGVGEGNDRALVRGVLSGRIVTTEQGVSEEKNGRPHTVLGAHRRCKYAGGIAMILGEEARPSGLTTENVGRWLRRYDLAEDAGGYVPRISSVAGRMSDVMYQGAESVVDWVDESYPEHANVADMVGDGNGQLYVVSHHPYAGLNRQRLHHGQHISSQVYYDSLGAALGDLENVRGLTGEARGLRAAALVMRSAATLTVISGPHPEMGVFEAFPNEYTGVELQPLSVAA